MIELTSGADACHRSTMRCKSAINQKIIVNSNAPHKLSY